jgi:uncharacterized protein (TIGR00255 family)
MTGFGKNSFSVGNKTINIEIRSLNSKQLDTNIKLPHLYKEKESELRKLLSEQLIRGKVELYFSFDLLDGKTSNTINTKVVDTYLQQLTDVLKNANMQVNEQILSSVLQMPQVLSTEQEIFSEEEWKEILPYIKDTVKQLIDFRSQEGEVLSLDLRKRIALIEQFLKEVDIPEKQRIERTKERIRKSLIEAIEQDKIDENRFEQELIYYLEKFDITEEKIRLAMHCKYFVETLENGGAIGKKLNFISQEIGREINTLGSKANDAVLQKIVIQMKDELEKIKEQSFNIV